MNGPNDSSSIFSSESAGPRRFAIFGVLDERAGLLVRGLRERLSEATGNRLALSFPVHVTIRGRFLAHEVDARFVFGQLVQVWAAGPPGMLSLSGPAFCPPDLAWLQVEQSSLGYESLARLHREADAACLRCLVRDEVSAEHAGDGFSPHVTLGWGVTASQVTELLHSSRLPINSWVERFALARYPSDWSQSRPVELIQSVDISGWPTTGSSA